MALIRVPQQSTRDVAFWNRQLRIDKVISRSRAHRRRVDNALAAIEHFVERVDGACYAGVSWGKDSTVLAHLVQRIAPNVPLVWVRVEPIANPHCVLVRDAFLQRYGAASYREIEIWCTHDAEGWHASGTLERGFKQAAETFGGAHISGLRGSESGTRKLRMMRYGVASDRTCAPIGWWSGQDVFAYLYTHDLPVHPAYAMSVGGMLPRERIRVASLGGKRGDGRGRAQWERRYYGDALRRLRAPTR